MPARVAILEKILLSQKSRRQNIFRGLSKQNLRGSLLYQQLTYGLVSKGFFAEILRKVRGTLQRKPFIASGKGAEILQKV